MALAGNREDADETQDRRRNFSEAKWMYSNWEYPFPSERYDAREGLRTERRERSKNEYRYVINLLKKHPK
jgi:hypothetical protein